MSTPKLWGVEQVAHDLPADRRVGVLQVEEPVDHRVDVRHVSSLSVALYIAERESVSAAWFLWVVTFVSSLGVGALLI
jgi:hypothetical protein